jgi:N-methylhydantoinase B
VDDDPGEVVAFVQAFGHHDDIGGCVPGSMPSGATSVYEEGLMVPPIKLWDQGVPNQAALTIMTRNSRMPDSLAGDLDAECSACLMGSRRVTELFERYGATPSRRASTRSSPTTPTPTGARSCQDPGRHLRVGGLRRARRRRRAEAAPPAHHAHQGGRRRRRRALIIDFTGTSPQAKGPINHVGDAADGNFLKKWLAPILRNLADTPERMAELDVNEGIVELIEMRFPEKGTLLTPIFPAPTNARTFVILRLLGVLAGVLAKAVDGTCPPTRRRSATPASTAARRRLEYLMREVLGGGSGGRYYADGEDTIHVVPDSRNLPTEFTESRFPFRVESLGLAQDSGGPGQYRGGLGYDKHIRMLEDAYFMSIADRSILSCWGVKGGKAGAPFRSRSTRAARTSARWRGWSTTSRSAAGEVIRIRTTGGGGWGDPLERDVDLVRRDVRWGKVSREGPSATTAWCHRRRRRPGDGPTDRRADALRADCVTSAASRSSTAAPATRRQPHRLDPGSPTPAPR